MAQYQQPQQGYQQPPMPPQGQMPPQPPMQQQNMATPSIGNWIGTFILLAIPIVDIIMLFVWAFGSNTMLAKKNFARAYLILFLIVFVITLVLMGILVATGQSINFNYKY